MRTFKSGNVVRMKGDVRNPAMTVEQSRPAYRVGDWTSVDYDMVFCRWFDQKDRLHEKTFPSHLLELVRE